MAFKATFPAARANAAGNTNSGRRRKKRRRRRRRRSNTQSNGTRETAPLPAGPFPCSARPPMRLYGALPLP